MSLNRYDIIIIGGGIIGATIAYRLALYKLRILVLEKNPYLAEETSAANSGLIHGGFDPEPGKLEARFNVEGNKMWQSEIFPYLDFPRRKIDSVVVALSDAEVSELNVLYQRGLTNGVHKKDLKIVGKKELLSKHPCLTSKAKAALICTSSWLIDPVKASLAMFGAAVQNGVEILRSSEVVNIKWKEKFWEVKVRDNSNIFRSRNIINAAGHYADTIANLAGQGNFELIARRGEYKVLSRSESQCLKAVYFMVPTVHGKGVLVAPLLDGKVLVGPTAEDGVTKEDTRLVTDVKQSEIRKIGHHLVPNLDMNKVEMTLAGSRPIDKDTDDFIIAYGTTSNNFINVAGMQSPAIASAPAIAFEVEKLLKSLPNDFQIDTEFNPHYKLIY